MKDFENCTKKDIDKMTAFSNDLVIEMLDKFGIRAGSVGQYSLYRAFQNAIKSEWEIAKRQKVNWLILTGKK